MSKNYVQAGERIDVTAPYAVASGAGCLVGTIFGVAETTTALNATVSLCTNGVWDLVKIGSQAWTVGQLIYWDDTNKRTTNVLTGNTLIGKAVLAVGSGAGETTGRVWLTP